MLLFWSCTHHTIGNRKLLCKADMLQAVIPYPPFYSLAVKKRLFCERVLFFGRGFCYGRLALGILPNMVWVQGLRVDRETVIGRGLAAGWKKE